MSDSDEIQSITDLMRTAVNAYNYMLEAGIQRLEVENVSGSGRRRIIVTDAVGREFDFLSGENRHTFAREVWRGNSSGNSTIV